MSAFTDEKDLAEFRHDDRGAFRGTKDKLTAISVGQVHALSLDERQAAWQLAREADPGPRWYSHRGLSFVFCCMVCCMGSADGCELTCLQWTRVPMLLIVPPLPQHSTAPCFLPSYL